MGTAFDEYADDYEGALQRGLSVSGESSEYFMRERMVWLAKAVRARHVAPARVMDFGCGTGNGVPFLRDVVGASSVVGVDTSERSLEQARTRYPWAEFAVPAHVDSSPSFDLIFTNGTFHHIPPSERAASLAYIRDRLRPGGLFALSENNPWNPGTQLIMRRIPFDRDAVKITAGEARRLLSSAGFDVLSVDFLFVFPRALQALRPLERHLSRWPLGGQYVVLARRPG